MEEALSNAVYHRAYDEREPIEVRVEKDRIEIVSFPGPDRSVTIEGLKNYRVSNRRYRNRRIGDFLKELHLTEGRNTGFKKILDSFVNFLCFVDSVLFVFGREKDTVDRKESASI